MLRETSPRRSRTRFWRRMALAAPISFLIHLIFVIMARPEYKDVMDKAVNMEIIDMSSVDKKETEPESKPEPKPIPEPASPAPEPGPAPEPEVKSEAQIADISSDSETQSEEELAVAPDDTEGTDGSVVDDTDTSTDEESGICMHDLFPYATKTSNWLLWISLKSLRDTQYESNVVSTFNSYSLFRRLVGATGLNPTKDIEGILVAASNIINWRTFRVIATYESGESSLRNRLDSSQKGKDGFGWRQTKQGWEATAPGEFKWHLVGSGHVMAVNHAPSGSSVSTPSRLDANPFMSDTDSALAPKPALADAQYPEWPKEVKCLTENANLKTIAQRLKNALDKKEELDIASVARSYLGSREDGSWPVFLLVTKDPRAVGLGGRANRGAGMKIALVRTFLSDPVHVEGEIYFAGDQKLVEGIARTWKQLAAETSSSALFRVAGLAHVFDSLRVEVLPGKIVFAFNPTAGQVNTALTFLAMQGRFLEDHFDQ